MDPDQLSNWRTLSSHDGTEISYWVQSGDATPIVLANGLGGTLAAWRYLITDLNPNYQFVTWDYRGLYRSAKPANSEALGVEDHVRDLEAVLLELGVQKAVFCGWSMGVQVILEYYRLHPEAFQAMIALNGTAGSPFSTAFRSERSRALLPLLLGWIGRHPQKAGEFMERFLKLGPSFELLKLLGFLALPAKPEDFEKVIQAFKSVDLTVYSEIIKHFGNHDSSDVLHRISCPVLIMAGEKDLFTPRETATEMARKIPDHRLSIIAGGTHYTALEFPHQVSAEISRFLTEALKKGSN